MRRLTFLQGPTEISILRVLAALVTVAPGLDVVAVISSTSASNPALAVGAPAQVLIKASNVLVGVD